MEIKELEQIVHLLKHSDITEFEFERDGTHLKVIRGVRATSVSHPIGSGQAVLEPAIIATHGVGEIGAAGTSPSGDSLTKVESPIVGTFYRKPSTDAEPFVKEGDSVEKGQTLCIIEAMKLMNEIESPCDGKVQKILISDGKMVEFGEVLFHIEPTK